MFDHVTLRVADVAASTAFYRAVLDPLGIPYAPNAIGPEWEDFSLMAADDEHPPSWGAHLGFVAPDRAAVEAFWAAGRADGAPDDGAPGPRPEYAEDYFGGFLRDPDDNSAEAVHGAHLRTDGVLDHVWLRVADVAAAHAFYARVAEHAGFALVHEAEDRVRFRAPGGGSLTLVAGTPSRGVHVAFPAPETAVRAFHAELTGAGYRDNGAPGERPVYHPGYFGAFVLDPDGNNIELVDHHR